MANKIPQAPPPPSEANTGRPGVRRGPNADRIQTPGRLIEFYPRSLKERTHRIFIEAVETFRRHQIVECCTWTVAKLSPLFYAEIQSGVLRSGLARQAMEFLVDELIRLNCDKELDRGLRCRREFERSKAWRDFIGKLAELEGVEITLEKESLETSAREPGKGSEPRNITRRDQRQPLALTERRARAVKKLAKEIRTIRPEMHNASHYAKVEREHRGFLLFKIARKHSDVRSWIENVADRRATIRLAQEIAARHFKVTDSTVRTDWSHRKKPRRTPKKSG